MKADLHIHTSFSDGLSSPQDVVNTAIEKGINCICITDHDEIGGALEAMRFGFDKSILVVPGIELTTDLGHILGINIKKKIPKGLSAEQAIKEIRKQGGLAIIAHPFAWPIRNFAGGEEKIRALAPDGIEAFNASVLFESSNQRAINFAQSDHISFTAGSDSHRADFLGRGYLEFSDNIQSAEDLLGVIKNKKAVAKGVILGPWELFKMIKDNPFRLGNILRPSKLKGRSAKKG